MTPDDRWSDGDAYESYVGRWSRLVAPRFVDWLAVPGGRRWLDVGCGTGALTSAILTLAEPSAVVGIDPSAAFIDWGGRQVDDPRARFMPGTAEDTGLEAGTMDVVVSALVLSFVPDLAAAIAEARRVVVPGGIIGGYVWDYASGMELLRCFWDAAVSLDADAAPLDEAARFPQAQPAALERAGRAAGLVDVAIEAIEVSTPFRDLDDLWRPFLAGTGPAPAYVATLPPERVVALHDRLASMLPVAEDGSVALTARAWAVAGRSP